jgi:hypothetical protein
MAFSARLAKNGTPASTLKVNVVTFDNASGGWKVTTSLIKVVGDVPDRPRRSGPSPRTPGELPDLDRAEGQRRARGGCSLVAAARVHRWGAFVYRRRRWIVAATLSSRRALPARGQRLASPVNRAVAVRRRMAQARIGSRVLWRRPNRLVALFRLTGAGADATSEVSRARSRPPSRRFAPSRATHHRLRRNPRRALASGRRRRVRAHRPDATEGSRSVEP